MNDDPFFRFCRSLQAKLPVFEEKQEAGAGPGAYYIKSVLVFFRYLNKSENANN